MESQNRVQVLRTIAWIWQISEFLPLHAYKSCLAVGKTREILEKNKRLKAVIRIRNNILIIIKSFYCFPFFFSRFCTRKHTEMKETIGYFAVSVLSASCTALVALSLRDYVWTWMFTMTGTKLLPFNFTNRLLWWCKDRHNEIVDVCYFSKIGFSEHSVHVCWLRSLP